MTIATLRACQPKVSRHLRLIQSAGELRTNTFQDRDHLVVPVVALVEGVIWPVNAPYPELVLAEEIAKAPAGWNGRPCVPDHPADSDTRVSANDPKILEGMAFGLLFNSRYEDKRLKTEAWIDLARAAKLGGNAQRVVERARANDPIEVSVGAFIVAEVTTGEYNGQKYEAIWREIVPDHLAMLPEGSEGACSVEMGCGAPRVARHILTRRSFITVPPLMTKEESDMFRAASATPKTDPTKTTTEPPVEKRTLRERLGALFNGLKVSIDRSEMTDVDLRDALREQLVSREGAAFGWIEVVKPDAGIVVYTVMGSQGGEQLMQRGFSVAEDGVVSLTDDRVEVDAVVSFEPVKAAQAVTPGSCGCSGKGRHAMDRTATIKGLIDNPASPFTADDQKMLDAATDERLTALSTAFPAKKEPETKVEPEPKADAKVETVAAAKPQTVEQYLKDAPDGVREVLAEGMRAASARKEGVIKTLRDSGRCPFSDDELKVKSIGELDALLQLSGITVAASQPVESFGVMPRSPRAASTEGIPAPVNIADRFRKAKSA